MKTIISAAASTLLMLGSAAAREVTTVSPILSPHESIAAERRVAQFASSGEGGIPCTTNYILTHDQRGWYLRKEVDCEE